MLCSHQLAVPTPVLYVTKSIKLPMHLVLCVTHVLAVSRYVYARRPWPHPRKMVDAGLLMQNRTTGYICVDPKDQKSSRESGQCKAGCTARTAGPAGGACPATGCCGSASAVLPSCHQLDGKSATNAPARLGLGPLTHSIFPVTTIGWPGVSERLMLHNRSQFSERLRVIQGCGQLPGLPISLTVTARQTYTPCAISSFEQQLEC